MPTPDRKAWIDHGKTLLIFLVVCCHVGLPEPLCNGIGSFYMPAFFIISGYLYKPQSPLATLRSFAIPTLFCIAVNTAYNIGLHTLTHSASNLISPNSLRSLYRCVYHDPGATLFPGFWFIFVLLCCRLLIGDLGGAHWFQRHKRPILPLLLLFMTAESLFVGPSPLRDHYLYRVPACLPFMIVGLYLKRVNIPRLSIHAATLIAPTLIILTTLFAGEIDVWCHRFGMNYLPFFLLATAISLSLFRLLHLLPPSSLVRTLSNGTFLILGLHYIPRDLLHLLLHKTGFSLPPLLSTPLLALLILALLYPLLRFCERHIPQLLGKKKALFPS